MKTGFIGLGNMGAPMAANLAKAGHDVTGFDLTAPCPDGVAQAASATKAATGADVVITMLPNGAILREVAARSSRPWTAGAVLCDCSTVDVDSARAVADQADAAGLGRAGCPGFRRGGRRKRGHADLHGGRVGRGLCHRAPLFDIMGQKAVHCGARAPARPRRSATT